MGNLKTKDILHGAPHAAYSRHMRNGFYIQMASIGLVLGKV
jgi:hypothetical protein